MRVGLVVDGTNVGEVEVLNTDDGASVLDRIALVMSGVIPGLSDKKGIRPTLPSYLRYAQRDFVFSPSLERIEVTDIRTELTAISSLSEIVGRGTSERRPPRIDALLFDYSMGGSGMTKHIVGMLWLQKIGSVPTNLEELRKLSAADFRTTFEVQRLRTEYPTLVKTEIDAVKVRVDRRAKALAMLTKFKPVAMDEFQQTRAQQTYIVAVGASSGSTTGGGGTAGDGGGYAPQGDLFGVFDAFTVSTNVPFVALSCRGKMCYKVLRDFDVPERWIVEFRDLTESVTTQRFGFEGLYIKVLHNIELQPKKRRSIEKYPHEWIDTQYGTAIWNIDNSVTFTYEVSQSMSTGIMTERLFESFGLPYTFTRERQTATDGGFTIPALEIVRIAFADMVNMVPEIGTFLYFDESQASVAAKERFHIYFTQDQRLSRIKLTMSQATNVTLRGAVNVQQVRSLMVILSHILGYYTRNVDSVLTVYRNVLPNLDELTGQHAKKEKPVKVKKTGKRSDALYNHNPEMFGGKFTTKCQQKAQPYLVVGKREADAHLQKLLTDDPALNDLPDSQNLALNFPPGSDDYYFCAPREPTDTDQRHIWPGLHASGNPSVPFFPCCYIKDQTKKNAGGLKAFLRQQGHDVEEKRQKKANQDYVLDSNKAAPLDRYAEAPYHIEQILRLKRFTQVKRGKSMVFPIVRCGVGTMGDSFVHCLARATNTKYLGMTPDARIAAVQKIKKGWLDRWDEYRASTSQELLDVKPAVLEDTGRESDGDVPYIDPLEFVGAAEMYYKCNVILIRAGQNDSAYPKGEFSIPGHDAVYMRKRIDPDLPTYIIVLFETDEISYPYKCEIMCDISEGDVPVFDFRSIGPAGREAGGGVLKTIEALMYEYYQLCQVSTDGSMCIAPADRHLSSAEAATIFTNVAGQSSDERGKTRVLKYTDAGLSSDLYLYTSPIAPIIGAPSLQPGGGPFIAPQIRTTIKDVQTFVARRGLKIVAQALRDGKCIGFEVAERRQLRTEAAGSSVGGTDSKRGEFSTGFIPVRPSTGSDALVDGVPLADAFYQPPVTPATGAASELDEYRKRIRVANLLMQYALYAYAIGRHPAADPPARPDAKKVTKGSVSGTEPELFVVDPSHDVFKMPTSRVILRPEDDKEELVWRRRMLIVPDEETRKRLASFVATNVYNNRDVVLAMRDRYVFDNYYTNPTDFAQSYSQIVFTSTSRIERWRLYVDEKKTLDDARVEKMFRGAPIIGADAARIEDETGTPVVVAPPTFEPYFFKIGGKICIIQNVRQGERDRALTVAERWREDGVNVGANVQASASASSAVTASAVTVYKHVSNTIRGAIVSVISSAKAAEGRPAHGEKGHPAGIIEYSMVTNDTESLHYAAVLFFE